MSLKLQTKFTIICTLLTLTATVEAKEYRFNVSNSSAKAYCQPLEIKIINNGQQVANGFSPNALNPGSPPQTVILKSDFCTQIQFKTVCSGQVNQHTRGCYDGAVIITSETEMN